MTLTALRRSILTTAYHSQEGHIPSAFSCLEILWVLYTQILGPDDRFILSKGHASLALYQVLAEVGKIPRGSLEKFASRGSPLGGHPDSLKIPAVTASTGSLGHGLAIGVGISLAKKILGQPGRVWVLVGDGECQEGSVWEAARLAASLSLPISVIVDHNRTHGRSLTEIWKSFGWGVFECSGHSEGALKNALQILSRGIIPWVLIAETVKGRGCPTMEADPAAWHHRILSHEEFNGLMLEVV